MRLLLLPLYFPLLISYIFLSKKNKYYVKQDILEMNRRLLKNRNIIYYLIFKKPFRNLYYYRLGKMSIVLARFYKPYPLFFINSEHIGGGAFFLNHPYSTIINAKRIGFNFTCRHLTTIGNSKDGRNDLIPTIGNNVNIGANVIIIGKISIGDNVIIGAGSVVVNNIPSNSVVVGNPARIIKKYEKN